MVNYQNGKIYKIVSNTDDELCYVGNTTLPLLCKRMVEHRSGYKRWKNGKNSYTSSYILFDKYGIENCHIELIEMFPCNSKDELTKKEGEYIRSLKCVNKNIAGRTVKEWCEVNKKKLAEKAREYGKNNKETRAITTKKWRNNNPEAIKKYYEATRDTKIQLNRKWRGVNSEKYTCCCGSIIRKYEKLRHERSLKHINYCASVSVASPCSIVR
jgi:hypothetical protein